VSRLVTDQQQRNRDEQARLYGAPLGDLLRAAGQTLGLTQAKAASLLGLSAPMLSQLMSGHRVKIGNPSAVQRLQLLVQLADEVDAGRLDRAGAVERIEVDEPGQVLTRTSQVAHREGMAGSPESFASVATAAELFDAARLVEAAHPRIAALLRTCADGAPGRA